EEDVSSRSVSTRRPIARALHPRDILSLIRAPLDRHPSSGILAGLRAMTRMNRCGRFTATRGSEEGHTRLFKMLRSNQRPKPRQVRASSTAPHLHMIDRGAERNIL